MVELLLGALAVFVLTGNCWIAYKITQFYTKRIAALRDVIRNTDDDYCMCGDSADSHSFGSGHAPIGMRSYYTLKVYEMRIE